MYRHLKLFALLVVALGVAACNNTTPSNNSDAGLNGLNGPAFGIAKKSEVGDRVWFDANCDGIQDKDEYGVKNVTVYLKDCTGQTLASTTTDDGGYYLFTELEAGDYMVCFDLPAGFEWTLQNVGDDAYDSDVDANGCTECFSLGEDKSDLTRDAGLCEEKKHEGGDGCTPGYWKTKANDDVWGPTGFHWDEYFDDVFGCGPHKTLLDVMWTGGGQEKALYRHAVAALLNAAHPDVDYDLSVGEVIDLTCNPGDVEDAKNTLAGYNEQGCPINAHGEVEGDHDDDGGKPTNALRGSL